MSGGEGPVRGGPRHALVTGASAGLGRALAVHLLSDGWSVTGVDRDDAPAPVSKDDSSASLSEHGPKAAGASAVPPRYTHIRTDLAERGGVDALLARLAAGPALDAAFLCAGISATGRFEAIPSEAHRRLLAVNLEAPLVLADGMLSSGTLGAAPSKGAALVLIASLSVDVGYPGAASYAASKDALAAYGRSIAKARPKLDVLTVLPGPIRTEHAAKHAPAGSSDGARMDPADLARRIVVRAERGGGTFRPGLAANAAGLFGRLAPGLAARAMRRGLFAKLDRDVW